ncbi:MAG: flavodoxin-dependent (E)-4-hydroxy-3-methylbut-2-enyl-diphosphate synthase [Clostridia bacterium]|nr:flavodoxin-dependent (E)-4-hydroxy-3-methylbut-2-enyl-diphosphate synthase [Clostridia bacterium]
MSKNRVYVGGVPMGAGAPVTIQSMTNTDTRDAAATIAQILELERAGCEIVRSSVYDERCVEALPEIIKNIHIPLVADIHFDHRLAIGAMKAGVSKVRINPGNIGSEEGVRAVALCAKERGIPIRIGVNGGSLEKELLKEYGVCAEAMVISAVRHAEMLEKYGFSDIMVSLKASDPKTTVEAYRMAHQKLPYPLHLGVTEAGLGEDALIKSAIGIGSLLLDGIGDTVRVSMTGGVVQEVEAAKKILEAAGVRKSRVRIVSCPTCGRTRVELEPIAARVKTALDFEGAKPITVAVMGCAVNGPGEAKEADIGIAFGSVNAAVFKNGEIVYTDKLPEVIDRFIEDARSLCMGAE